MDDEGLRILAKAGCGSQLTSLSLESESFIVVVVVFSDPSFWGLWLSPGSPFFLFC